MTGSNLWSWQRAQLHGQGQDGPADVLDLLVGDVQQVRLAIPLIDPLGPQREESRGDNMGIPLRRVGGGQQVACDLLLDELIKRLVHVEGVDHPVAVTPGLGIGQVPLLAGALGVPSDIQPVPAPALAVPLRREELVDDLLAGWPRGITLDRGDLFGGRRQADEVEANPPQPDERLGVLDGLRSRFLLLRQDEIVHGTPGPILARVG